MERRLDSLRNAERIKALQRREGKELCDIGLYIAEVRMVGILKRPEKGDFQQQFPPTLGLLRQFHDPVRLQEAAEFPPSA